MQAGRQAGELHAEMTMAQRTQRICRLIAAFVSLSLGAVAAQAAEDEDLAWGRFAWQNHDFREASTRLSAYKTKMGTRANHDVDYMLATSWCRIPEMQEKGVALLTWLSKQKLSVALRETTAKELSVCASSATLNSMPLAYQKGASSRSQGSTKVIKSNKLPA